MRWERAPGHKFNRQRRWRTRLYTVSLINTGFPRTGSTAAASVPIQEPKEGDTVGFEMASGLPFTTCFRPPIGSDAVSAG